MKNTIMPGAHAAAPAGTYALVGGTTAVFADIQRAINHDYATVFPVAAVIILLNLILLLRSVVAPWYLLASVGLGWAPAHGLELTGDLGVSRNGAFATTPGSPSNPLTRLLGRGGSRGGTTRETRVDPLLQLGVRVLLP